MSTRSGTWRAPRTIAVARGLWLAALGGLAALYFHGTVMSTIELMDEGQVVYSSWRVAEGEMPYVGFHQLYGPSVLFVIVMTPPRAGPATHAARARQWAGGVRILALGGTLAFAVAYVAPHLATVSAILMLAPLAVLVAGLVVREMAGWPPHDPAIAGVGPIALVSVGAAIPVLAYVALYWRIGALAAFVHDTMVGLPQQIAWFVPLRQPELATVCLTATICASFALVRRLRRGISLTGPLLVCVGAIAGLLVDRARNPGVRP